MNSYDRGARARSVWSVIGIILAVAVGIASLIPLAAMAFLAVAMSHYGSNK